MKCEGGGVYHCMTRTVNGEIYLSDEEKEFLYQQIVKVAEFSGINVLSYCLMGNHFHLLVRTPNRDSVISDEELVRRYAILYNTPNEYLKYDSDEVQELLLGEDSDKNEQEWMRRYLMGRMGDLSIFMKCIKQRFSVWYNERHKRFGTLWSERFKSVLIEDLPHVLKVVSVYIALNPVRAGLVEDPQEYKYSSFSGVCCGDRFALKGLCDLYDSKLIEEVVIDYQRYVYSQGVFGKKDRDQVMPEELSDEALKKVEMLERLFSKRSLEMTRGLVLGSQSFVEEYFYLFKSRWRKRKKQSYELLSEGEIFSLGNVRP